MRLAILDIFGVKTTSFATLLAGAGLAIGAAWSGMLGNFAAGVFMQVLRPYKVGDFISAVGTVGTVKELGLFARWPIARRPGNKSSLRDSRALCKQITAGQCDIAWQSGALA